MKISAPSAGNRLALCGGMTNGPVLGNQWYRDGIRARFGDALLSRALLNRHELDLALQHSEHQQVALVDAVVDMGFVTEIDSYNALAQFTGLRLGDLPSMTPSNPSLRL